MPVAQPGNPQLCVDLMRGGRQLTRDEVLATALYRIPVGMDDIAEMGARDPGLIERSALGCAGGQPYLRRVFLHELKPGAPLDDLSMFAIYGAVADGKVHPRPLLAPFPWRDEEVICVGEGVEEALAVERMLAEGKGICMPIPWRSLCSGGGT